MTEPLSCHSHLLNFTQQHYKKAKPHDSESNKELVTTKSHRATFMFHQFPTVSKKPSQLTFFN